MHVLVPVFVTPPGGPVLPSWSQLRRALDNLRLLDLIPGGVSLQSRPRWLAATVRWMPRVTCSGRFLQQGEERFYGGVVPDSTNPLHGFDQFVRGQGMQELSASKLTARSE